MIVVDTNVIAYLFLTSPYSRAAEQLFLRDPEWAAPRLWRSEFRNVLTLYLRKELLSVGDTAGIFKAAAGVMAGREFEPEAKNVLRLAAESGCSAYDCEFVDTASSLGVPLYTVDSRLLQSFPEITRSLEMQL